MSNNVTELKLFGEDVPSLSSLSVISGSLDPQEAGSLITLETEQPSLMYPNQIVYFAMKTEDQNGNFSLISNIVKISVDGGSQSDAHLGHFLTALLVPAFTIIIIGIGLIVMKRKGLFNEFLKN